MKAEWKTRGAARRRSVDGDGVVTVEQPWSARERALLAAGIALVAILAAIGGLFWSSLRPKAIASARAARTSAGDTDSTPSRDEVEAAIARSRPLAGPITWLAPEEAEAAAKERAAEPPRGRRARLAVGIGAFPAPGTKKIKEGIVVPDDFPLPPGYVRHYQTTDRGEMLQAVLMFHPDFKPVDAHGEPIPIPADRVVPPEMAPPGLAIERLAVPKDAYITPEEQGITEEGDEESAP